MKILVITGGSGGHIFPALSFLSRLQEKHPQTDALLVLPKKSIKARIDTGSCRISYISISQIKFSLAPSNFIAVFNFIKGSLESLSLLVGFRPDIVIGFGSLDCVPMIFFAWMFRIKTLIHEQNVIPGRANRLLAKFADRICVSFAETKEYLKGSAKRLVVTGNPIRSELTRMDRFKALDFFGLNHEKFTILVMGGSQGSQHINAGLLKAMTLVSDLSGLQVIHIAGGPDCELMKDKYRDLNIEARVFDFFAPMQYAYNACDLTISRSGAISVTEIMFYRLPAILVPYPYAYRHQLNNARVLESKGCSFIINDEDLETDILGEEIESFMHTPQRLKDMHSRYGCFPVSDAAELLVGEAISLNRN